MNSDENFEIRLTSEIGFCKFDEPVIGTYCSLTN
jgi:hypothetical protein